MVLSTQSNSTMFVSNICVILDFHQLGDWVELLSQ